MSSDHGREYYRLYADNNRPFQIEVEFIQQILQTKRNTVRLNKSKRTNLRYLHLILLRVLKTLNKTIQQRFRVGGIDTKKTCFTDNTLDNSIARVGDTLTVHVCLELLCFPRITSYLQTLPKHLHGHHVAVRRLTVSPQAW